MTITTRPATATDLPALVALFHEMEVHYDGPAAAPAEVEIVAALQRHAFAPEARVDLLVAEAGGRLRGFAFARVYPAAGWGAATSTMRSPAPSPK
jgi:hypothetical protein